VGCPVFPLWAALFVNSLHHVEVAGVKVTSGEIHARGTADVDEAATD